MTSLSEAQIETAAIEQLVGCGYHSGTETLAENAQLPGFNRVELLGPVVRRLNPALPPDTVEEVVRILRARRTRR